MTRLGFSPDLASAKVLTELDDPTRLNTRKVSAKVAAPGITPPPHFPKRPVDVMSLSKSANQECYVRLFRQNRYIQTEEFGDM